MTTTSSTHWVAECFWPGVREEDLRELDRRVLRAAAGPAGAGGPAGYLGCLRITDDDVVLFLFEGPIGSVQQLTDETGIRAERILHCVPHLQPPTRSHR